jgi:putative tRNA adenosine deaminase-associated protein
MALARSLPRGQAAARRRYPALPIESRRGRGSDTIPSWMPLRGVTMTDVTSDDFCVIVYRDDDAWEAEVLPVALTENLAGLIQALRQQPSMGGTIGLAAVGDDFFVALRVAGGQESLYLSDLTAAVDWPLARQVLDYLGLPVPEDEDLDQVLPAGDMSIFADLGLDEMELGALSGDLDLFPDEVLASIARRIGFGPALERALGAALRSPDR